MKIELRSQTSTGGRRMAGARALWKANGLTNEQLGKPIIAIVNSFTQFVPGHVHLHEIGQKVKAEIEKLGCFAAEFNTIAIDDGIAMGHDGMLYSLPSRDIIADSVEYMVNALKADAMVCISNCDKITPGMLMAAMRLNIPAVFVSGGPMEAGELEGQYLDLVDAMVQAADDNVSIYGDPSDLYKIKDALTNMKPDVEFIVDEVTYLPNETVTKSADGARGKDGKISYGKFAANLAKNTVPDK